MARAVDAKGAPETRRPVEDSLSVAGGCGGQFAQVNRANCPGQEVKLHPSGGQIAPLRRANCTPQEVNLHPSGGQIAPVRG